MKYSAEELDEMIRRHEQQLKAWKEKRKQLRTAEARRAKQEAEEARQQELMRRGLEVEAYRDWMQMTIIRRAGEQTSVLEFFEKTKEDGGLRIIADAPDPPPPLGEHQGADATQPEA